MFKRSLLIAAFLLSACGGAEAPTSAATEKPADNFLTKLQTDYPATLSKIAENVWVHTTNYRLPGQNPIGSNGLVVVDGDDVILVDGAWGELATLSLLEKVKAETGKAVTKMVVTHHLKKSKVAHKSRVYRSRLSGSRSRTGKFDCLYSVCRNSLRRMRRARCGR